MRVSTARVMGFCNGVRRALRIASEAARRHGGIQTDGLVVHNAQAVEELERLGMVVSEGLSLSLPVLVRAHGMDPVVKGGLGGRGLEVVDATCPVVASNQRMACEAGERGETVLFAGDRGHAETRAVTGAAGAGFRVVSSVEELEDIRVDAPVFFMAQTTFDVAEFSEMALVVRRRWPGSVVRESICRATRERQESVGELCEVVERVVVVGGRGSANTRRLVEIAEGSGVGVVWVETASELRASDFIDIDEVGVTAGASTPDWVIEGVMERLREF